MNIERNFAQVIEDSLGLPLESTYLTGKYVNASMLHDLAFALEDHYSVYRLPEKAAGQLRPYFPAFYENGRDFGLNTVFRDYQANNIGKHQDSYVVSNVKKHLLYAHAICIHDALSYLLDYFRLNPKGPEATRRFEATLYLLREYASMAPLLRGNILIPITDKTFGFYNHNNFYSDAEEIDSILLNQRKDTSRSRYTDQISNKMKDKISLQLILPKIKEQLYQRSRCSHRIDLTFPSLEFVDAFRGLLWHWQSKFTSSDIALPFTCSAIGQIEAINPEYISITDIVAIREQDANFAEFRLFLENVLSRLDKQAGNYNDYQRQFIEEIQKEFSDNRDRLLSKTRKEPLGSAFSSIDKVVVGATAGALVGGDYKSMLVGAATGALPPAYEFIKALITNINSSGKEIILRNHFLALGVSLD